MSVFPVAESCPSQKVGSQMSGIFMVAEPGAVIRMSVYGRVLPIAVHKTNVRFGNQSEKNYHHAVGFRCLASCYASE